MASVLLCDPRTPIARGIEGHRLQTRIERNIEVMFSVQDLTRFILDAALTDGLRYGFVERTQTPAPAPETEVWVLAPGAPVPWEV